MEYLLTKLYTDPSYSMKSLTNFQLKFFYNYFKYEFRTYSNSLAIEDIRDKKETYLIYKKIKQELKSRIQNKASRKNYHHYENLH